MRKVAVLGGTSPFTAAFIDALAGHDAFPDLNLCLFGRNAECGQAIGQYAQNRLGPGWKITWTDTLGEALEGAGFVVNQIRFGGLALRAQGEALCAQHGVQADETLGPAALLTALTIADDIRNLASRIRSICPDAWVLQLVNPLSAMTSLMAESLPKVVGLCELPRYTLEAVLDFFPPGPFEWHYSGLNHRGFLHHLFLGERDLVQELPLLLGNQTLNGIAAETIAHLQAVPLKYFNLLKEPDQLSPARAHTLETLRQHILLELKADPHRSPPSLAQRYTAWYPKSVVPVLFALLQDVPSIHVVNLKHMGMVRELKAQVSKHGIVPIPAAVSPSPPVKEWLYRLEWHERNVLRALKNPTKVTLAETLAADPIVPIHTLDAISHALIQSQEQAKS